jgi:hypothetical protein
MFRYVSLTQVLLNVCLETAPPHSERSDTSLIFSLEICIRLFQLGKGLEAAILCDFEIAVQNFAPKIVLFCLSKP